MPPTAVQARGGLPESQNDQAPNPANPSGFAAESRRTLKELHRRLIGLAEQLIERSDLPDDLEDLLAVQPTRIESAKAGLKSAELAKQAAEIAVTEFENWVIDEAGAIRKDPASPPARRTRARGPNRTL